MESGKWQQAEELLKKAVEASPDDAEHAPLLGRSALASRSARAKRLTQIEKAVKLDPTNAELTRARGRNVAGERRQRSRA